MKMKFEIVPLDNNYMHYIAKSLGTTIEEISRLIDFNIRQSLYLYGGVRKSTFMAIKYVTSSEKWDEAIRRD